MVTSETRSAIEYIHKLTELEGDLLNVLFIGELIAPNVQDCAKNGTHCSIISKCPDALPSDIVNDERWIKHVDCSHTPKPLPGLSQTQLAEFKRE